MIEDKPVRKKRRLQLNEKRRKLLQGIGKGLNVSEAGRLAGYGRPQSAHYALNRIKIHAPEILQRIGLLPEKLLKRLVQKLDAKETQFFSDKGIVMDRRRVVAHDIQLRAIDMLARMYGFYPRNDHAEDDSDRPTGPTVNLVIPDPRLAAAIAEKLSRVGRYSQQSVLDVPRLREEGE